jgi:hypothetical protein
MDAIHISSSAEVFIPGVRKKCLGFFSPDLSVALYLLSIILSFTSGFYIQSAREY